MSEYEQSVFISYAWGTEREDIVNEIDETLQQRGIRIVRDKRALGYRGSIRDFMERIGRGSCVIVVISDKYLRSPNCMFELVEIADNKQFHDRVFPVILTDANIYDPLKRIEYIKYWEGKRKELAKAMKTLDPANLQGIREEMDQYDRIRDKISGITSILKDMNTLTPDMHRDSEFSNLYEAIIERLRETSTDVTNEFNEMAKKADSERKAKEEAEQNAREESDRLAAQRAEEERKAKEDAERVAAQKAEEERTAKVEAERKAKAEAERLAKIKAEEELAARAKVEKERREKEEAHQLAAQKANADHKAKDVVPAAKPIAPVQKKRSSNVMMYGIGVVVLLAVVGIGYSVLSGGNRNAIASTPTINAAIAGPATEVVVANTAPAKTATSAPTNTATVVPTPIGGGSGKIVFTSDRDDPNPVSCYPDCNYEIYIMDVDGSNVTRLTNSEAYDGNPAWSLDGNYIIFTSDRDGDYYTYSMNVDGSNVTRLTNNAVGGVLSPDGKHVAFSSDGEIYIMNADGSNKTRLTGDSPIINSAPAWSPNGKYIAYESDRGGKSLIYVMNADGSNQHRLTDLEAHDRDPAWSPDGKYIAFRSNRDGDYYTYGIYIMNADGSNQTRLTNTAPVDDSPAWSPDGKFIAFTTSTSYSGSECHIYIMKADGSGVTQLTNSGSCDAEPAWQP